jgi:hypothetical protein
MLSAVDAMILGSWRVGLSGGADHSFSICHRDKAMRMCGKGGSTGTGWNEEVADG